MIQKLTHSLTYGNQMNKEQKKTLVELWNEVGERPSYMMDEESPYYPRRVYLSHVLETILEREFSSENEYHNCEFVLTENQLTGDETPFCVFDHYSSFTLNDFRSIFDWEEKFSVEVVYPYEVQTSVSEYFECTSKDDVRKYMSGSETSFEPKYPDFSDFEGGDVELLERSIRHEYHVHVNNLRLKESVVEDMNVSVS